MKKNSHKDPYLTIPDLCSICSRADTVKPAFFYHNGKDENRIVYYGNTNKDYFTYLHNVSNDSISKLLSSIQNVHGVHYFFLQGKPLDDQITQKVLMIRKELGLWKCLGQLFTSKSKKHKIVLYSYVPLQYPNLKKWSFSFPESSDSLCKNGDFENLLSADKQKKHIMNLQKNGASISSEESFLFPDLWWQSMYQWDGIHVPEIRLVENQLDGKYSLLIKGEKQSLGIINSPSLPLVDSVMDCFIKAKSDSILQLYLCSWNPESKMTDTINHLEFRFSSNDCAQISLPVKAADYGDRTSYYFSFQVDGEIILDDVIVCRQ